MASPLHFRPGAAAVRCARLRLTLAVRIFSVTFNPSTTLIQTFTLHLLSTAELTRSVIIPINAMCSCSISIVLHPGGLIFLAGTLAPGRRRSVHVGSSTRRSSRTTPRIVRGLAPVGSAMMSSNELRTSGIAGLRSHLGNLHIYGKRADE